MHVWSKNSFKNQFSLSTMWVPGIYITQVHQAYWQAPLPTEPSFFHLFNISFLKGTLCVLSSLKTRVEKKATLGFSKPSKSWLASSCSGGRFEQQWWLRQQQLFCLVPPSALVTKISVPKTFQCQNSYSQYPQWNCAQLLTCREISCLKGPAASLDTKPEVLLIQWENGFISGW